MKRIGFILFEAILAALLVSACTLMLINLNIREDARVVARQTGKELATLLHAVDRRVLLDGRKNINWNVDISGVSVVDELHDSLIGEKHNTCAGSWDPVVAGNEDVALIGCDFWNNSPMNAIMDLKVESVGGLNSWALDIYHSQPDRQNEFLRFANETLNSAKSHSNLQMTGRYQYTIVDRSGNQTDVQSCLIGGLTCAIRAELILPKLSTSLDAFYRLDGDSGMIGGLTFAINSMPSECFDDKGNETPCGLDFDPGFNLDGGDLRGNLDMNINGVNAQNIRLASKSVGVVVECVNAAGDVSFCGVAPFDTQVSDSFLQVHHVGVLGAMVMINSDGKEVLRADELGVVAEDIALRGELKAKSIVAESDLLLTGLLSANTYQTPSLKTDGTVRVGTIKTGSKSEMSSCTVNGAISTNSKGIIMACQNKVWQIKGVHPVGGLIYTRSRSCPSGFTDAMPRSSITSIAQQGFLYQPNTTGGSTSTATTGRTVGSNSFRFLAANLPNHSHNYTYYNNSHQGGYPHKGGNKGWTGSVSATTSSAGSGAAVDITARGIVLTICKKI